MHPLFLLSIAIQVVLGVHAYRNGRVSPWLWVILIFPFVGSLIYVVAFLLPGIRWSPRGSSSEPLSLNRVPPGPFASLGDRPDAAIAIGDLSEIEARVSREDCASCTSQLVLSEHTSCTLGDRKLRAATTSCTNCGIGPTRYFELKAED